MDATTSITPAQVVALAEQISNGAKGIQQKLDDLDAKVNTLRASWDGAAQEAYDQAQLKWT
ncbi:MAG: WXG100 family type VII secretion target, partial [Microbacterium sp.]